MKQKNYIRPGLLWERLYFILVCFFCPELWASAIPLLIGILYSSEVNFVGWKIILRFFEGGNNYGMYIKIHCYLQQ